MSISLAEKLKKDLNTDNEQIDIIKIKYYKKSNKLKLILKCKYNMEENKKSSIKKRFQKIFSCFEQVEVVFLKTIENVTTQELTTKYWIDVVSCVSDIMPIAKQCLSQSKVESKNEEIKLSYGNQFLCKLLKEKGICKIISETIKNIFDIKCRVTLDYDKNLICQNYIESKEKQDKVLIKNVIKEIKNNENIVSNKSKSNISISSGTPKNANIILGRNHINDELVSINSVNDTSGVVAVSGEIFKVNIIETKSGKKIVTFYLTDYTNSITVKCFPRAKDEERVLEEIKKGICCKVKGEATNDPYAKEVVIMARNIVKYKKEERPDLSEEKRVELHLHTQMSAMDAVSSTSKLIERAAKWGHKAIAITDHGVVQAFPEAMDAAKKYNIKIIYGVEAYLVDDGVPIVLDPKDKTIDDTFVVFDLETTGLSNTNNKIIEIGAVKIKDGEVIDTFSEFVNPEEEIPFKITELTSITNEMVNTAPNIDVVLPKFMDFIKDSVVVAHNAAFDVGFIKTNCKKQKFHFKNSILDTVPLCKFLFPELKRYKLNVICKHLGISLENHHRAVDDAKATADILLRCFKELKDKKINTLKNLNKEFLGNIDVKKLPTYHLIILTKDMIGLKNLYKLISFSNLDHFYKKPRMPKSLIQKHRDGLMIGSACEAGQIFKEVLSDKSDDEIKETLDFYDYLEIQPIENNEFMIRNSIVKDKNQLKQLNRKIYDLGKKYNKPVVATGDVHFLDPKDAIFREILLAGQGFSDASNQPPLYFKTTDDMLKEFSYLGKDEAKEVVITNPNIIADSIDLIKPIPDETFPPKIEGAEEEIRTMTINKAHSIYGDNLPEIVSARLDKELNSIINNGYAVLYLIAQKLVEKSDQDGYLVGSRGSVGSSLVATMCNITEVNGLPPHYVCPKCKYSEFITDGSISSGADLQDKACPKCGEPLKKDGHDIPFETFLGFEGDKEPDIDLNFSGEYQPVVHKYTEVLFGKGHVFRAGTIGTIAEKTAYGFVKKYLTEKNIVANQAEIDRLTIGCSGIKRTTGQHPGGVMVVPDDNEIYNFTPIQHPADDNDTEIITTHFDYHSISGRLLKLDILGHDDPTVLRMLQDLTGVDPKTLPLGDPKVMSLFTKPDALGITQEQLGCEVGTYGLPEFGTKFVRQMLIDTKPKTFSDLVRISGLSHGTDVWLNNAQYYIKEGYTTLENCIATRDDIMVYLIYRGLPPKIAFNIMEKVRKGKGLSEEHEKIMKDNKVPDWYIESCKKIKYMFPKGHAVAYVMMAVRIAYFKVYYPKAYYATYFSVRADDFDADVILQGENSIKAKINEIVAMGNNVTQKDKGLLTVLEISYEMYKRGIKFLNIDLYESDDSRFLIKDNGILIPINSLQGVGNNAAKNIVEARKKGKFISKEDLRIRTKISKTVIETLDKRGCLKGLPETNQLSLF